MYLSSRFAACVGIAAVLASGAAHAELAARPVVAGMRPRIVTRGPHVPFSGPAVIGRHVVYPGAGPCSVVVPRHHRGYGVGSCGYGIGFDGTANADFAGPSIYPPAPDAIAAPPPFALPAPPAPVPQIIEINGGLAHKATTRVVSGSPCRR